MDCFALREVLFWPDREDAPEAVLDCALLEQSSAWCAGPGDEAYNQPVCLPYAGHAESLWREDGCYDIVVVMGYNDRPIVPGCGSAVFLHVADADFSPTKGGIALAREDLLAFLRACSTDSRICIVG